MAPHKWIKKNVYECTAGPYDKVAEGVYNDFQRFHKNFIGFFEAQIYIIYLLLKIVFYNMFRIFIRLQVMKENRKINQVEKKWHKK